MKENNKRLLMSELKNKDFGWKFGRKRNLEFHYINCEMEKRMILMEPNDRMEVHACEGHTISWEGIIEWDGRRVTEIPC